MTDTPTPNPQPTDDSLYFMNSASLFDSMDDPGGKTRNGPINSLPQFSHDQHKSNALRAVRRAISQPQIVHAKWN